MNNTIAIALPKLCLWYDPVRIQTWPRFLSKIKPEQTFRSPTDFALSVITERQYDIKHAAGIDFVRSFPGLEKKADRLVLKGVGILQRSGQVYELSSEARELAEAYTVNPKGKEWVRLLGKLLLCREPRFRVFISLLSKPAAQLIFRGTGWFSGSAKLASLKVDGEPEIRPFESDDGTDYRCLRQFIVDNSWWAIGSWRDHPLLSEFSNCLLTGQLSEKISLDKFASNLRPALEVLLHLNVIRVGDSYSWLDQQSAVTEFGMEVASDFGWGSLPPSKEVSIITKVTRILENLRTDSGYVVASELRGEMKKIGIDNPDLQIERMIQDHVIALETSDYGQSRHGVGLFGDPAKQLVKLRVLGGIKND